MYVDGTERRGTSLVNVTMWSGGLQATTRVLVATPSSPVRLALPQTLHPLSGLSGCAGGSNATVFQSVEVVAEVDFANANNDTVTVDVTRFVRPHVVSSNNNVVRVLHDSPLRINAMSSGISLVEVDVPLVGTVTATGGYEIQVVNSDAVSFEQLSVVVLTSIEATVPQVSLEVSFVVSYSSYFLFLHFAFVSEVLCALLLIH